MPVRCGYAKEFGDDRAGNGKRIVRLWTRPISVVHLNCSTRALSVSNCRRARTIKVLMPTRRQSLPPVAVNIASSAMQVLRVGLDSAIPAHRAPPQGTRTGRASIAHCCLFLLLRLRSLYRLLSVAGEITAMSLPFRRRGNNEYIDGPELPNYAVYDGAAR